MHLQAERTGGQGLCTRRGKVFPHAMEATRFAFAEAYGAAIFRPRCRRDSVGLALVLWRCRTGWLLVLRCLAAALAEQRRDAIPRLRCGIADGAARVADVLACLLGRAADRVAGL